MNNPVIRLAFVDTCHRRRAFVCASLSSENIYAAPFESIHEFMHSSGVYDFLLFDYDPDVLQQFRSRLLSMSMDLPLAVQQPAPAIDTIVEAIKGGADIFIDSDQYSNLYAKLSNMTNTQASQKHSLHLVNANRSEYRTLLSNRECDVIEMISAGHTSKYIAHHLQISNRTVDAHRSSILRKFKSPRMTDAVRKLSLHMMS